MKIIQLPENIVNQIAAGEVIERPASVVKELVENALDANARKITIVSAGGGLSLIRVSDDGCGIAPDQIKLALSRHCTSKLSDDLLDIRSLGFRGEALPSIGSVSQLSIASRVLDADTGMLQSVKGGKMSELRPVSLLKGTQIEVLDLFFNTPARLKFMKGERAESAAITDVVRRIALSFPHVRFELSGSDRQLLTLNATQEEKSPCKNRIGDVLGTEFIDNSVEINALREGVRLTGFVSLPSYNRAASTHQFAYVNGRPVKDKQIAMAIRAAYMDAMAKDRHAVTALFLELEQGQVDVNVHPTKADVRFRDAGLVRGLIIGAIREALAHSGVRSTTTGAEAALVAFSTPFLAPNSVNSTSWKPPSTSRWSPSLSPFKPLGWKEPAQEEFLHVAEPSAFQPEASQNSDQNYQPDYPLGVAKAQIAGNYIVAESNGSLILVDQHAAHERLVFETLKTAFAKRAVPTQLLLIPQIIDLPEVEADLLAVNADEFEKFGLILERFGPGAIVVRSTPSVLGKIDVTALVKDLLDELREQESSSGLALKLDAIASKMACHGSVRSGRILKIDEMNALLRQMEQTPGSSTCNHGRPTFIQLQLHDIEKLFGRK
jgi:DNA mismatch repair protein MutL